MPTETAIKHLPADLPDRFDGIKQEAIVLSHLAGLLELVKLDDASRDTIERSYDRARHVTGLYQNDDMGCLLFASGLFAPSGKRIYIGLCRRDEDWHLDCTLRRAPDSREPVGELLLPDGAAPADAFDTLATNLEEDFSTGNAEVADKTAENDGSVTSPDAPLSEMDAEIAENEYSVISPNALLDVMDMEIACYNSGATSIDGDTAFRYTEFASYFIYPDPDAPSAFRTMLKNNSALRNAYLDRLYLLISALLDVDDELVSFDIEKAIKLLDSYNSLVENPATPSDAGDKSPEAVDYSLPDEPTELPDGAAPADGPDPLADLNAQLDALASHLEQDFSAGDAAEEEPPAHAPASEPHEPDAPKESAEESAAPAPVTRVAYELWDTLLKLERQLECHLIELKHCNTDVDTSSELAELDRTVPDFIGQILDRPDVIQHELETDAVSHRLLIESCDRIIGLMRDMGLDPSCMERLRELLRSIDPQSTDEIVENEGCVTSPASLLEWMDGEISHAALGIERIDQNRADTYDDIGSYFTYSSSDAPSLFQIELKNNAVLRGEFLTRLKQLHFILSENDLYSLSIDRAIELLCSYDSADEEISDNPTADDKFSTLLSTPVENPATPSDAGDKSPEAVETPVETEQNSPKSTPEEPIQPEENILPDEPTELHNLAPETAPAPSRLTGAQMQQIYDALVPPFSIGKPEMLNGIAMHLTSRGIFWRAYGYDSALQMLSDLPELFHLSYDPRRESPRVYYVTIQPWPSTSAEASTKPEPETEEQDTNKPPFSMTERLIQFPISQQTTLSRLVNGEGLYDTAADPLTQEQLAEFRGSYDAAVAEGNLRYDPDYDCYRFPLTLLAQDGSAVSATLKRSTRPNTAPWYVSYIKKERGQGVRPGDRLMNFAYIGDKQEFLRSLAEHAEPEQWGFSGKEDDFTILWNYIRYTFYRVEFENKVLFDEEGRFAAFDTGLLSRRFGDPLYAIFEPNQPGYKSKWKFSCFCSTYQEGTRQERNMAAKLSVKPQMPSYFTNIYDTIFDPDAEMQINYEHIFRDNLERFPMKWVRGQCNSWKRSRDIIKEIDATDAQITEQKKLTDSASTPALLALRRRRSDLFRKLGEAVNDTSDEDMCSLFDNMIYNLQGCINKTLMRSRRNHQLAEPCFFPTRNVMSMLLPIRLYRTDTPDLALVLERQKSTVYIGRTVITMAMAYKNARLLRRFTSDWLNNAAIRDDELDED